MHLAGLMSTNPHRSPGCSWDAEHAPPNPVKQTPVLRPGPGPDRERRRCPREPRAEWRTSLQELNSPPGFLHPEKRPARECRGADAPAGAPPRGGPRLPGRPRPRPGPASRLLSGDWTRTPPSPPSVRSPLHLPLAQPAASPQPPLTLGAETAAGEFKRISRAPRIPELGKNNSRIAIPYALAAGKNSPAIHVWNTHTVEKWWKIGVL